MKVQISNKESFKYQQLITVVGVLLFLIKLYAWYKTGSVAILTDTLESTINVVAGFIGLYSLYLSGLPKDKNHPYGHGKIEFISASIEGTLIFIAGIFIIYEAIGTIQNPSVITQLDLGLLLVAITAVVNFIVGYIAVQKGRKNHSLALIASGKHLQTDTYSTIGIILGLVILYFTNIPWIDAVTALVFAIFIMYTGYKIIREAISGIMDESDEILLKEVVQFLEKERRENWIDLHNLRIIKYGSTLHFDCHMTVPWYFNIEEGHREVDALEDAVIERFGDRIELFVHLDACKEYSCSICSKADCPVRKHPFEERIKWTVANTSTNKKHHQGIKVL